jgi:hypothetical protein
MNPGIKFNPFLTKTPEKDNLNGHFTFPDHDGKQGGSFQNKNQANSL